MRTILEENTMRQRHIDDELASNLIAAFTDKYKASEITREALEGLENALMLALLPPEPDDVITAHVSGGRDCIQLLEISLNHSPLLAAPLFK